MCEDDSDDFVHVETPSDVHIGTEDTPSVPYSGDRPRRFLRHIRRQNSPRDKLEKSWAMHEISGERVQQIEVCVHCMSNCKPRTLYNVYTHIQCSIYMVLIGCMRYGRVHPNYHSLGNFQV